MASIYGALICPHCLNCVHSFRDPEIGYDCPNYRNGMLFTGLIIRPKVCDDYYPDEKYIRENVEEFISRYKKEETV